MKELRDVVNAYKAKAIEGRQACLATVVDVLGSAYRRPGARMVVFDDGTAAGNVSGGCLDRDIVERAKEAIRTQKSALAVYDTSDEFDIVFGAGVGCSGKVQIFLEPLCPDTNFVEKAEEIQASDQDLVLATCFFADGTSFWQPGERLVAAGGTALSLAGKMSGKNLTEVIEDANRVLEAKRSLTKNYGTHAIFFEFIQPAIKLVVCGAGDDAIPLVRLAKELGWHVTVFDTKPVLVSPERFELADSLLCMPHDEALNKTCDSSRTAFVVMTHNFASDLKVLEILSTKNCPYIGLLGPQKRYQALLSELRQKTFNEESVAHIYAPVGLDLGAETPAEIALSVISEIQAVMSKGKGGMLRDKTGPIHTFEFESQKPIAPSPLSHLKVEEIICRP